MHGLRKSCPVTASTAVAGRSQNSLPTHLDLLDIYIQLLCAAAELPAWSFVSLSLPCCISVRTSLCRASGSAWTALFRSPRSLNHPFCPLHHQINHQTSTQTCPGETRTHTARSHMPPSLTRMALILPLMWAQTTS